MLLDLLQLSNLLLLCNDYYAYVVVRYLKKSIVGLPLDGVG